MPEETGQTQEQGQQPQGETPVSFEDWLGKQDETTRKLYEEHTKGLKSALQGERDARKAETAKLSRELREASKRLEEGSEARKALEGVTGQLEAAEARAAFYEEAIRPEIGCNNPRLAFIAAQDGGLIDGKGRISWDVLKAQFPELFRPKVPPASAGAGTQAQPPRSGGMNEFIRKAAGRT
jgi:hypothetical protein